MIAPAALIPGITVGHSRVENPANANDSQSMKAARQFEALFVKQLLSQINLGGGEGAQADFVNSMWRDQLSSQISQSGLGLAEVIVGQLDGTAKTAFSQRAGGGLEFRADLFATAPVDQAKTSQASGGLRLYQNLLPDPPSFSDAEQFINTLKPHIEQAAQALGVSPRVLMAQAALETGWGKHLPQGEQGQASHNLFGIKADASWRGEAVTAATHEFDGEKLAPTRDGFRRYASYADSVADYVDFLRAQPRYKNALNHGGDDKNFIQGLKSAGYATDPQYVDKVFEVADSPRLAALWTSS